MVDTREARASASEIKFVLDPVLGQGIREWARTHLEADPYGTGIFGDEYRTTSLYFDTEQYDVFHRRGSFGRAKYRIRRYTDSDFVFLERKLRKPGIVVKRRTKTPLEVLHRLKQPEPEGNWPGDWFHQRLLVRGLRPVCQISYHRMARGTLVGGEVVRLTLDDSVGVAPITETHFNGDHGTPILDQQLILELKFRGYLPAVFKRLVEEFRLDPQPASKYRYGMMALGHVPATDEPPTPVGHNVNA